MTVNYVRLKELLPDAVYEEAASGKCYCGSALMQAGIPIPVEMGDYRAYQFVFRVKEQIKGLELQFGERETAVSGCMTGVGSLFYGTSNCTAYLNLRDES